MAKKKPATDLLENPVITEDTPLFEDEIAPPAGPMGGIQDGTPFDKAYDVLTATTGPRLELMTRTTKKLARALDVGYNLMFNYRSRYVRGRLDMIMRTHVSIGGKGRAEMVQSLQAGSGVPGEYYDKGDTSYKAFLDPANDGDEDV